MVSRAAGTETERSEGDGSFALLCVLSPSCGVDIGPATSAQPSGESRLRFRDRGVDFRPGLVPYERAPRPIASQRTRCHQRDPRADLAGPFGPERVYWSPRAYRVQRGEGMASAVACVPRRCPQAAKRSRKVVLDAVNLIRWSFCFRRRTRLDRWAVLVTEDGPFRTSPLARRSGSQELRDSSS